MVELRCCEPATVCEAEEAGRGCVHVGSKDVLQIYLLRNTPI